MSRKYKNFVERLDTYGAKVLTTEQEFLQLMEKEDYPTLSMSCHNNHVFDMKTTSLANKFKSLESGKITNICSQCIEKPSKEKENIIVKCKELNFEFLGYEKETRRVEYKCHCGNITTTHSHSILKEDRKSHCIKCQNNKNRTPFEEVQKIFEENGCKFLSKTYTNKDALLDYECSCGNVAKISLSCFKSGERCSSCRQHRYKQTCLEKYGVDNVSKVEEFKKKGKETCFQNYGVEHNMQNKEIKEKAEETCLEKYGVKWSFTLPEVYEKIRKTHKEKYGVEYPLQSQEIQDKIDLVFVQKYGVTRPFLSPEFIKKYNDIMQQKYGVPWFTMTKEFADKTKETNLKRYGVENAMQNPLIFKKAMESSFRRREYVSQDGKTWFILGYEDECLDTLINDEQISCDIIKAGDDDGIPVCKYVSKSDGKNRVWYPDIWIEGDNRLIEVKSTWTYNYSPDKMKDKMDCCEYDCELWIYDGKKNIYEIVFKNKDGYRYLIGSKMEIGVSIDEKKN
jgi:hypothetical protein